MTTDLDGEETGYRWLVPDLVHPHPDNVRADLGDLTSLTDSIREQGILEPLLVIGDYEHGYQLVAGHRRLAAAKQAGLDYVPVIVRPDLAAAADTIAAQLVENDQRKDLTVGERAAGYNQLALLGLPAAQIAKRTGTKVGDVHRLITVSGSERTVKALTERTLTLEQAAAIAEFADDPEEFEGLLSIIEDDPDYLDHTIANIRQEREEHAERDRLTAELVAQGFAIVDLDKVPADCRRLYDLTDDNGREIQPDEHATTCEGRAVSLNRWRNEISGAWCLDPTRYGHTVKESRTYSAPAPGRAEGGKMTDEQKKERALVVANNKAWRAAEGVRRQFVRATLCRKTPPKPVLRWAIRTAVDHPWQANHADNGIVYDLFGKPLPTGQRPNPAVDLVDPADDRRLPLILFGFMAAGQESSMDVGTWRYARPGVGGYLRVLEELGYRLADVEKLASGEPTEPEPEPEPDHQPEPDYSEGGADLAPDGGDYEDGF